MIIMNIGDQSMTEEISMTIIFGAILQAISVMVNQVVDIVVDTTKKLVTDIIIIVQVDGQNIQVVEVV